MFYKSFLKELIMDLSQINWVGALACVVIAMASGFIWYNPKTFFNAWWEVVGGGKEMSTEGSMSLTWGLTVLSSVVQGIFATLLIPALGGVDLTSGLMAGFWLWLGIIAPTNLVNKLFAGHGLKVWAIEAGNHLLNYLLFGAVLGAFF
jgi:hypothetical protein